MQSPQGLQTHTRLGGTTLFPRHNCILFERTQTRYRTDTRGLWPAYRLPLVSRTWSAARRRSPASEFTLSDADSNDGRTKKSLLFPSVMFRCFSNYPDGMRKGLMGTVAVLRPLPAVFRAPKKGGRTGEGALIERVLRRSRGIQRATNDASHFRRPVLPRRKKLCRRNSGRMAAASHVPDVRGASL